MVKYTLRALCLFIISLIVLGQMARADVINNITFTVKNDGAVAVTSDYGQFTTSTGQLLIEESNMPPELRDSTLVSANATQYGLDSPVGYRFKSINAFNGVHIDMSMRLGSLLNTGNRVGDGVSGQDGNCNAPHIRNSGSLAFDTTNINYSRIGCRSNFIFYKPDFNAKRMYLNRLTFEFMEGLGGVASLASLKAPAGIYKFEPKVFKISGFILPTITSVNFIMNVTVVVEPSIASVNMPTALPLDVAVESGNKLTGQGSVLATVTGTLGSNLKILPASANNGQLVKGAERIPYTLSVVPLSGDNKSRLLIDGSKGGALSQVVIETFEKRDQYQFRFDAGFATTLSNLSSGRFSDNVTLIFTTTDLP